MSNNRTVDKVCYDHKMDYHIVIKNGQTAAVSTWILQAYCGGKEAKHTTMHSLMA